MDLMGMRYVEHEVHEVHERSRSTVGLRAGNDFHQAARNPRTSFDKLRTSPHDAEVSMAITG